MSASGSPGARRGPGERSVAWRDAQAGVPSAWWPRAQLAFKDSMARGILQFTPGIAFRYVLHRCESRDIRCRESYRVRLPSTAAPSAYQAPGWGGRAAARRFRALFLGALRAGFGPPAAPRRTPRAHLQAPPGMGTCPEAGETGGRGDGVYVAGRPGLPAPTQRVHMFADLPRPGLGNDPSAGSPTETLLRLLLPLNDKVQWTSRDVAGGEPLASPRSEHFTGPFNR